jgi:hypothetical protein
MNIADRLSEILKTPQGFNRLCQLLKSDKRKDRYAVKYIGPYKGKDRFDFYLQAKKDKENDRT